MKNGTRRDPRGALKNLPIHPLQAAGRGRQKPHGPVVVPGGEDEGPGLQAVEAPVQAIPVSRRARAKARARKSARRFSVEKVIAESGRWLDLISKSDRLT